MALCWHSDDGHAPWGWPGEVIRARGLGDPSSLDYCIETEALPNWPSDPDEAQKLASRVFDFLGSLELPGLTAEEYRAALWRFWQGENRALRRSMGSNHRTRCERGRGFLINRVTRQVVQARCKSWRYCQYCAWLYGRAVEKLFKQVQRLRAFVVFTMPAEFGDWSNKEHIALQARAKRRLEERLNRKFGRRFSMLWTREHNTKGQGAGRLHLNVLWDESWVDQAWLSETATACGFGEVVHISRIGPGGQHRGQVERYATKCLRYATKDLSSHADWPKGTRRWGASRAARAQMKRPDKNPDWYWSPVEPPSLPLAPPQYEYWLLPESYLPHREPSARPKGPTIQFKLPMGLPRARAPDPIDWH